MKNKLEEIKRAVLSGEAALSDEEKQRLANDIGDIFRKHTFAELTEEMLPVISEIMDNLYSSNLADIVAGELKEEGVFNFGNKLNNAPFAGKERVIHGYLNIIRNSNFLVKIKDVERWASLISGLIDTSNYTFDILFRQRLSDYGSKPYFRVIRNNEEEILTWNKVGQLIESYERALINLLEEMESSDTKVAFLLENSVEMAALDFACLKSGIVNIMIPANSVEEHVAFILNETETEVVFVQNEKQLFKLNQVRQNLHRLKKIVLIEGKNIDENILSFEEFLEYSKKKIKTEPSAVDIHSLATIMYTSGTTGEPKGIMFSQKNIIYKRFCRALALPEIGDGDRFLSYLPLFHTFGRYLELMGSFFWGAQYAFMENPSVEAMLNNLQLVRPTIFISIPKKWIQLYEWISAHINIELDDEKSIQEEVNNVTGGALKWGLSAAGFLPPEIFRFFQHYGVELMSGFGMTEATGGITMTPPGGYMYNSLGTALPGIKIKVAEDGELLIKGEYVMMGYYGQSKEETFIDGWFPTGDIMTMNEDGFIEIIDRKKEIYKNIKGETIAPQKIENFFRDIDAVKQVFLVGDHRPFNTVLIYPNYENDSIELKDLNENQLQEYFSSVIVSINKFLAPFERILDFRIIDRPFSTEEGELTPKGTYKRRVIVDHFEDVIDEMYNLNYVSVYLENLEIRIPNWFLREKGILSRDIIAEDNKISIPDLNIELEIQLINKELNLVAIGSFIYQIHKTFIDFQTLLTTPSYWLGNKKLIEFTSLTLISWARKKKESNTISFYGILSHSALNEEGLRRLALSIEREEYSLEALNLAVLSLQSENAESSLLGYKLIKNILDDRSLPTYYLAVILLARPVMINNLDKLRKIFLLLDEHFEEIRYEEVLNDYLTARKDLIDKETAAKLSLKREIRNNLIHFENLIGREYYRIIKGIPVEESAIKSLYNILEALCARHPTIYAKIRRIFTRYQIQKESPELAFLSLEYRSSVRKFFRDWLGENQTLAVDPETGDEYEWSDVIIIDEDIDESDKLRIVEAITKSPLLREAIFLFSKGKLIRLNDILPGGVWVSKIRDLGNKKIFRASVQTRYHGGFDVVLNLIYDNEKLKVMEEINWLILAGTRSFINELVDDFGGYWSDYSVYSTHYMPGESVYKYLKRETKHLDENNELKLYNIFPFFVWNASAAYFNFWKLTDYTLLLENTSPDNFVVPPHDYQQGTKVISLSEREQYKDLKQLFEKFYEGFVRTSFDEFPFLQRESVWYYIFSGLINSVGIHQGMKLLMQLKRELEEEKNKEYWLIAKARLTEFLSKVKKNGYIPKQLYFAIKRFHRWLKLNSGAGPEVQAKMLADLFDTYNLGLLEESYPAVRLRFFKDTVFINANKKLSEFLYELISKFTNEKINYMAIQEMISESGIINFASEDEKFFLTRMSFPHLRPEDSAEFINIGGQGRKTTNLVIQLEDVDGNTYSIRNPVTPKEIAKLHQLFLEANLLVNFRPEHDYLVAISERGYIIGGLFYSRGDNDSIHMEKIVVSNAYRRKGVSEGLMSEFFNRARGEGVKYVTTGFFRPEYFYKFDFKIAPKYSGLVKEL